MSVDPSSWLEWPRGAIRVGVVFLVAVAALGVVWRFATVLDWAGDSASHNSALSFADREIAGGNGLVADQLAVYAARGLIPENATFHVAVDPNFSAGSDLTVEQVAGYYRYFLMPRRPAEDARWIVCYACDLSAYGASARVLWRGEYGISIVERTP